MTRRLPRLRALTRDELQTAGYLAGICSLVWWVAWRITPPNQVAGIVASLLFVQRLFPRSKKEPKRAPDSSVVVEEPGVEKDTDRRNEGVGDSGVSRRRRHRDTRRPLNRPSFGGG